MNGLLLAIERIGTTAALEGLVPEWEALWKATPSATPFQSPRWLLPWWRRLGEGRLATLTFRNPGDSRLVGLAPLYVYVDATGLRHLFPIGIGTTDYLDVLMAPGCEEALARALALLQDEWDMAEFPQLQRGSPLLEMPLPASWQRELTPGEPHPVLDLRGGIAIPRQMAQNLRTARARAACIGRLDFELADAATVPTLLDVLAHLHGRRWCERGEAGVLADGNVMAMHRAAAPLLQEAGLLRLWGLRLDGKFIAALYCLWDRLRCFNYIGGFDPAWSALSPGALLVGHAIEHAAAEGTQAFDFLRGAEPYKYRWGAVDQPMATLRIRQHGDMA